MKHIFETNEKCPEITPSYQFHGKYLDVKSQLFAKGVTFYLILAPGHINHFDKKASNGKGVRNH